MLTYLQKHFDFSNDNILNCVGALSLESGTITYQELSEIVDVLKLKDINLDDLFEESVLLQSLTQYVRELKSTEERWIKVFSAVDKQKMKNTFRIVSYVLSIPPCNASQERVFSIMNSK